MFIYSYVRPCSVYRTTTNVPAVSIQESKYPNVNPIQHLSIRTSILVNFFQLQFLPAGRPSISTPPLTIHLVIQVSIHQSIHPSKCQSVQVSIHPSGYPPVYPSRVPTKFCNFFSLTFQKFP